MHWSLTVWQFARFLTILIAVCTLPSLGAFPTDEVAGPSQESAAAALDLLVDETVDNEANAESGAPNVLGLSCMSAHGPCGGQIRGPSPLSAHR